MADNKPLKNPGILLLSGKIKTSGETYSIHILDESWADEIHALHNKVLDSLKPENKSFALPKTKEFFADHIQNGGIIVGAINKGRLIGKALMREPTLADPESGMVDMPSAPAVEKTVFLQSATVDPSWQGNGIAEKLAHARLVLALMRGREYACSEVEVENIASLKMLFKSGLTIESIGTDPADGVKVYNLLEPIKSALLKSVFNMVAAKDGVHAADLHDIKAIAEKLNAGYRGVGIDGQNKKLLLMAPPKK